MARNQNITGVNVTGNLLANDISVVIANQPQDPPPKNIRFKVEKPIQTFTGREAFLEDLHKVIKEGQITVLTQAPISVVAATGGIGKTETVRMYIQRHTHEYDHVIWIDAEDTLSSKNQFTQLAIKLNISTDFDGIPKEFELIQEQIFEKLLQNGNVVLLVFDNAEAFEDDEEFKLNGIRCLLPKSLSPFLVEPTVVVTSRNQNWSLQKVIQLDLWTESEVVDFVIQRLGLQETHENKELATQLGNLSGCLPIALQAAVAVILQQTKRRKKYGIQNLIEEYHNGSRNVLAQKPLDANMRPTRMSDTMLVLWNISLEKIAKFPDGDLAIKILCFMAHLSPTRIPQDFLFVLFNKDFAQDSIENALEILENYSLITCLSSADSDSHSFSIHRMVQDATIENLRAEEKQKPPLIFNENTFINEMEVLMKLSAHTMNYMEILNTREIRRGGEIVENLVHITNHAYKNLDVKEFRDLTVKVAGVLRSTNDFTKSIELYERVLKATPASNVKKEIYDKIELKWSLAYAYRAGGFDQKSIELFAEVLGDKTRSLGPHHKETLETKGDIANAFRRLGNFNEAATQFNEVLQDFRNIQDTQSESFLNTKNNYAVLFWNQRKTEDALKLYTQVLEEREKNQDSKPEDLIRTKGDIANLLREQGKLEEASAMMLQNISDATRVLGSCHLTTFLLKRNYADLLRNQGKHKEAAQFYLELLEIQETELGSEHPLTLGTKNNLAALYIATKELDKALHLLDVEVREKVFGPEHPETMTTAHNLAIVMRKQGKFKEVLALENKTLKLRTQVLGLNHPKTLNQMHNIGVTHYRMKESDEAAKVFQDVLQRREEVLGKNHPETMKTSKWLTKCRTLIEERNGFIENWNAMAARETFYTPQSIEDKKKNCEIL